MNQVAPEVRKISRPATSRKSARPTPATHCVGIVVAAGPQGFTVSSGDLRTTARRAVSCLLEPAAGDSVACLLVAPDEVWIVAVLTREEGVENRLHCSGTTRLEVDGGGLSLAASAIDLESGAFALRTAKADVTAAEASLVGQEFRLVGSTVKLVGALLSSVFDRVSHFAKHHQRTTEGIDRTQATYLEQEGRELLRLSGRTTVISGEGLIKAQAEQVHLG